MNNYKMGLLEQYLNQIEVSVDGVNWANMNDSYNLAILLAQDVDAVKSVVIGVAGAVAFYQSGLASGSDAVNGVSLFFRRKGCE